MMKKRDLNLDFIRCVAVLFVLSVHFFLNNGFYSQVMLGKRMLVATTMRALFITCVPLFIMLTGFLMNTKKVSKAYFFKIKDVLIVYILSTLLIFAYKIIFLQEEHTIGGLVENLLTYQQYSWYIEMYIGLYLLIPFLNLAWNNLNSKKERLSLIAVLFLLTIAPSITTSFGKIVFPDWWVTMYPLVYYFIGAFLSQYKDEIKLSTISRLGIMLSAVVISGLFSYYMSYGQTFIWGAWCSYQGIMTFVTSVCVFIFLLGVKLDKWPQWIQKIIRLISVLSLPIYLTSWIMDNATYKIFNNMIPNITDRFIFYIPIVLFILIGALLFAILVNYISNSILNLTKKRNA